MVSTIQKTEVEQLFSRARSGNAREREEAVEALTAYAHDLALKYIIARFAMRDQERASDIAQEVAVEFYLHLAEIDAERPDGWIVSRAWRRAIDSFRAERRLFNLEADLKKQYDGVEHRSPFRIVSGCESMQRMAALIEQLPARERIIVRLHVYEGLKPGEIGDRLALPPKTVSRLLKVVMEKLRQLYERRK